MAKCGSDNQRIGQFEFLTVTSAQSRRHDGNVSVELDNCQWEALDELANRRDRRFAIACRGYEGFRKG